MNSIEAVIRALPAADRSIIAGVQLERHFSLVDDGQSATLVLLTDRLMTADGGDGRQGVDGGAIACLREVIRHVLTENESIGMINQVIIRQRFANVTLEDF